MFARKNNIFPPMTAPAARIQLGFLLLAWLLVNSWFLIHRGIYLEGESAKYIQQAHLLLDTGHVETHNFRLYFVQIALIAAAIKFHLGFAWVVLLQLLFNLAAAAFFYTTVLHLFENRNAAFIATLLLLLNYPYQEFNSFLYTESLFFSFTLILSCYLIRIDRLTVKKTVMLFLLLTIICFTRPTGLLFLPPVVLYLSLAFSDKISLRVKTLLLAAAGIGFLLLVNLALGSGGEFDLMLPFRDEHIICGVPSHPGYPSDPTNNTGNSLFGLLSYVWHHPVQSAGLAGARTIAFFTLYRDYYGTGHNTYVIIFFSCIHLAVLTSIGYWWKNQKPVAIYLVSAIALLWITVMLTCDDWHNRFYLSISPSLILLAIPTLIRSSRRSLH